MCTAQGTLPSHGTDGVTFPPKDITLEQSLSRKKDCVGRIKIPETTGKRTQSIRTRVKRANHSAIDLPQINTSKKLHRYLRPVFEAACSPRKRVQQYQYNQYNIDLCSFCLHLFCKIMPQLNHLLETDNKTYQIYVYLVIFQFVVLFFSLCLFSLCLDT